MIDSSIKDLMAFDQQRRKDLKKAFSGKITGNFLLSMLYKIQPIVMANGLDGLFPSPLNQETFLNGDVVFMDHEICRYIVGAHTSNTIFLDDKERADLEKRSDYQEKLCSQVLSNIRLRNYAAVFFRKRRLISDDEYLYFNLPHDLFAMTIRMSQIRIGNNYPLLSIFYPDIIKKALSALLLLGDGLIDSAFPHCRSLIEFYVKLKVLEINPSSLAKFNEFCEFVLHKNVCEQEWPEEFLALFKNRAWKNSQNKSEYLHFGWVDSVPDYFTFCGDAYPYSIPGLFAYLRAKDSSAEENLTILEHYYQLCHAYAHGDLIQCNFPLNDYFQVSDILGLILPDLYGGLCKASDLETALENVDLIEKAKEDLIELHGQIKKRSEVHFQNYYKNRGL